MNNGVIADARVLGQLVPKEGGKSGTTACKRAGRADYQGESGLPRKVQEYLIGRECIGMRLICVGILAGFNANKSSRPLCVASAP